MHGDPIAVGERLELFVDRALIASSRGLRHSAIRPRREEVVFTFERPARDLAG
jgi:hypothetical protein